jgi:hypothetical protein
MTHRLDIQDAIRPEVTYQAGLNSADTRTNTIT